MGNRELWENPISSSPARGIHARKSRPTAEDVTCNARPSAAEADAPCRAHTERTRIGPRAARRQHAGIDVPTDFPEHDWLRLALRVGNLLAGLHSVSPADRALVAFAHRVGALRPTPRICSSDSAHKGPGATYGTSWPTSATTSSAHAPKRQHAQQEVVPQNNSTRVPTGMTTPDRLRSEGKRRVKLNDAQSIKNVYV